MKLHVISTILLVGACGGSDTDPGAGNDPGGGTQTLVVDGDASAEARADNARTAGDFDTSFSVRITLNGQSVTTGDVTVTSSSGTVALAFDVNGGGGNRWRGTAPGYDEVYILDITSGEDTVTGVRVDGPDIHVFDSPAANATVDSTVPLEVDWSRDDHAQSASIEVGDADALSIDDTGSFTLQPNTLRAEKDQTRENQIRIERTNRIDPAGTAGGSTWAVSVRNEIQVLAAPNPNLP